MIAGCSTTVAAYLAGVLPDTDSPAEFLTWYFDWMTTYLEEKRKTFDAIRDEKSLRLGVTGRATEEHNNGEVA